MGDREGLDGPPQQGDAAADAIAATPNMRALARRLFLVRPHESLLRAFHKAPWRGLRGAVRRLKRLIPAGVKSGLRAAFLVGPHESFLRNIFRAPGQYLRRRRTPRPIVNSPWPAGRTTALRESGNSPREDPYANNRPRGASGNIRGLPAQGDGGIREASCQRKDAMR